MCERTRQFPVEHRVQELDPSVSVNQLEQQRATLGSAALEELDGALVLLGRAAALERSKIAAPAGLRILFAGIQPVAA